MCRTLALIFALATVPPLAHAQRASDSAFAWTGKVPRGSWLRIHSVKGRVRVTRAAGDVAEVRAERRRRSSRRDDEIRFQVLKDGENVTVCALWPDHSTCDAKGVRSHGYDDDSHLDGADFTVSLPAGVRLRAATGNGEVSVEGATSDVVARSGNGDVQVGAGAEVVDVSSGNGDVEIADARGEVSANTGNGRIVISTGAGPVSATSGNGAIDVRMRSLAGEGDMSFRTGNGRVTVSLPADIQADVEGSTGNGSFRSDFPIQISGGRISSSRIRGTIGKGGRRIRLSSGNGELELKRI